MGEERTDMLDTVSATVAMLPSDRPRYFMGLGDTDGLGRDDRPRCGHVRLRAAHAAGPHRIGAHQIRPPEPPKREICNRLAATRTGLHLRRLCRVQPRAYIRHLVTQNEITGLRLLTIHNLHRVITTVREARTAIVEARFGAWLEQQRNPARIDQL